MNAIAHFHTRAGDATDEASIALREKDKQRSTLQTMKAAAFIYAIRLAEELGDDPRSTLKREARRLEALAEELSPTYSIAASYRAEVAMLHFACEHLPSETPRDLMQGTGKDGAQ